MKKYTLLIDTSASSPENKLYVFECATIKAAKEALALLNLKFSTGSIYCATIDKKQKSGKFASILRTDDGVKWNKSIGQHEFDPSGWDRVSEWKSIELFKA